MYLNKTVGENMNTFWKFNRCLLFFLLGAFCSLALAEGNYTTKNALTYRVRYVIDIRNIDYPALDYSLKFPLFQTRELPPYQKLSSMQVSSNRVRLIQTAENTAAVINFKRLEPGRGNHLEISYTFVNMAIDYDLSPVTGSSVVDSEYLKAGPNIESTAIPIITLAREVTAGENTYMEKAKRLFEYVNSNLEYVSWSGDQHSALQTLRRGWGSCDDYSLLYIALCRAVGIPARYVSGYRFSPREVKRREIELEPFAHAWVEINLPGKGWITVDPTYIYTVNGKKTVNHDFFGRITNDDRHLFFSYSREQERTISWNYETARPAKVNTDFHIYIREE